VVFERGWTTAKTAPMFGLAEQQDGAT